jgi:hypothetical protein
MKQLGQLHKLKSDILHSDFPIEYKDPALHDVDYQIYLLEEEKKQIDNVLYAMRITLWVFAMFSLGLLILAFYLQS